MTIISRIFCMILSVAFHHLLGLDSMSAQATPGNAPHATTSGEERFRSDRKGRELTLPNQDAAFSFAVIGDRTGGPSDGIKILAEAVDEINLLEPDLVMTVGDMVQGYNQQVEWLIQMREFRGIMDGLLMPWFPVAGNHDIYWRGDGKPPGEHESNYEQHFAPLWYAFDHKGALFVVLYSDEGNPATGEKANQPASQRMSQRQLHWLRATLAKASDAHHVFVFLHHPRWIGGRYGDDWEKVHGELVRAGNVKAVFAGHIHRMRYDGPRDGIEYVTLATTGGAQSGIAPEAGNLHHFHLVTVRQQQIAIASLPVGQTMNVREVTGRVSDGVRALKGLQPNFSRRFLVNEDGGVDAFLSLTLHNPTDYSTRAKLRFSSEDSRWIFSPMRLNRVLHPKTSVDVLFKVFRWQDSLDLSWRNPRCELQLDFMDEGGKVYPLKPVQYTIPYQIELPTPSVPNLESVVELSGAGDYLVVNGDQLRLDDASMTVECWLKPPYLKENQSLVSNLDSKAGFLLGILKGRPFLDLFLKNGEILKLIAPENRSVKLRQWQHVAGVVVDDQAFLYLDGVRVAEQTLPQGMYQGIGPVHVGAKGSTEKVKHSFFAGRMDGVRLSNVARYRAPHFTPRRRHLPDAQTQLLLNMDDIQLLWIYDESDNRAHAKVVGGTTVKADL